MRNAGPDEAQAGIKTARRNNPRYADDTTLMAESEEELKNIMTKWALTQGCKDSSISTNQSM